MLAPELVLISKEELSSLELSSETLNQLLSCFELIRLEFMNSSVINDLLITRLGTLTLSLMLLIISSPLSLKNSTPLLNKALLVNDSVTLLQSLIDDSAFNGLLASINFLALNTHSRQLLGLLVHAYALRAPLETLTSSLKESPLVASLKELLLKLTRSLALVLRQASTRQSLNSLTVFLSTS